MNISMEMGWRGKPDEYTTISPLKTKWGIYTIQLTNLSKGGSYQELKKFE